MIMQIIHYSASGIKRYATVKDSCVVCNIIKIQINKFAL
jgi:hypothetical protein